MNDKKNLSWGLRDDLVRLLGGYVDGFEYPLFDMADDILAMIDRCIAEEPEID
jgi:hypothetical protein